MIFILFHDYVDEASMPYGMPREGVEIAITIALFIANASVIFTLFAAWILRLSYEKLPQLIAELKRRRSHKQQNQHEVSDSGFSVDDDVEMAVRQKKSVLCSILYLYICYYLFTIRMRSHWVKCQMLPYCLYIMYSASVGSLIQTLQSLKSRTPVAFHAGTVWSSVPQIATTTLTKIEIC